MERGGHVRRLPGSMLNIPSSAEAFGFSTNQTGGHMARSMMLPEIMALCNALPREAEPDDYKTAIVSENILGKPTVSSREKSFRHLVQLYGLDRNLPLFRAFRGLGFDDPPSLPLIALTCAFCRDEQLRASFGLIKQLRPGELLPRERMEEHLETCFPARFSPAMKKSLAQNVNTTWTEAGHLTGRVTKRRALPVPRLGASTYGMFAGFLLGLRGEALIRSVFAYLVAPDPSIVIGHLSSASARGWLRFRHAGGILEIDFAPLLTTKEQAQVHVTS